jgi:hypothetical protein
MAQFLAAPTRKAIEKPSMGWHRRQFGKRHDRWTLQKRASCSTVRLSFGAWICCLPMTRVPSAHSCMSCILALCREVALVENVSGHFDSGSRCIEYRRQFEDRLQKPSPRPASHAGRGPKPSTIWRRNGTYPKEPLKTEFGESQFGELAVTDFQNMRDYVTSSSQHGGINRSS